ncbi:uncharacterized protein LOC133296938 [Gastrolobium bilobum]|uniref:uncharacterized protein LOC133296938 n=1 Tax=Gastrolobium bilobum TaxID=150636 RepID=UPI002AB2A421|nr:uncharacterized protein LOC133296938 [Gastrolobium bilobum]XP_061351968.1 uncharacterized protein LOC133296938 [Gastrolobium bilobum]
MYNQVNRGGHHFPPVPVPPPGYQQAPPHFQQFVPPNIGGPPPPQAYLHGPPTSSSTVPVNLPIQVPPSVMQNAGQSYAIPSQLHPGNTMVPQLVSSLGRSSQYSSNLGVQGHHIPPQVPPPPLGHSHQETSWAPRPPARVLPPPPPPPPSSSQGQILYNPPFHPPPPPPRPDDAQNLQRSHNTPPPLPPPSGMYQHSTVANYQLPSITPPPLPSSPPPVPPSPPPPIPPMTSASSHNVSGFELKAVDTVDGIVASYPSGIAPVHNSDPNQDSGSCREVAVAYRDELLSTRSMTLDLPPPPPRPTEEKNVQKIEALCQLIAENGADIEDKIRQDEFQNPEYAFLFGGDPGTEAAISNAYFLWMKKKCNLEPRWHGKNSESQLTPLVVDSSGKQFNLHVATGSADSDMEMEDDITLSDKDQGSNYAIEALTQQHDRVEVFNVNENSTENDHAEGILSCGASCFGSVGGSKQNEGPGLLSDLELMQSARSVTNVRSPVNGSTEVAEFPLGTVLERSAASPDDDSTQNGTSDHNEATNPSRDSGHLIRSGSPIRLLQDYASDDTSDNEDEGCAADAIVLTLSAGVVTGVSAAHKDSGSYLETDIGSKSPSSAQKGFVLLSKTSQNDSEVSPHLVNESKGPRKRSVSRWSSDGCIEHNLENQLSVNVASSLEAFQGKDGLGGTGIDNVSKSGNAEQENERKTSKFEPNVLKVDEFGRHPREGPTDSDSDDSRYRQTRRLNKRDRSWSRSRSPLDRSRRRRRRSPQRRKDKRSRSRSRSPRHRRSRSRSPISRRSGDYGGENVKRDKGQCFDFLRGKCYRGASCRYVHHESDKNTTSRRYRNKHDLEVYSHAKNSRINEGMKNISSEVSDYEHDGVRSQDVDLRQNVIGQEVVQRNEDSGRLTVVSNPFGLDGQSVISDPIKSEGFREVAPEVQEILVVREEPKPLINENDRFQNDVDSHQQRLDDGVHPKVLSGDDAFKPSDGKDIIYSETASFVQQIQSNVSVGVSEHSSGYPSQLINASFVSDSSPDKRSMISASASKVSGCEPLPYMLPSTQLQSATCSVGQCLSSEQPSLHSQDSKDLPPHSGSLVELPHKTYQLPGPPVVSHSQGENTVHMPQMLRHYGVMQQNAFFPFQSTTREKFEPYTAPLHTQSSHFSVPPNSSWTSLPPPPPPPPLSRAVYSTSLNSGVANSYISSEFNQSQLHSRTEFVSQTSIKPELPTHSQSSEFQDQAYPPMQDHSRTFMLTEAFSPKHPPQGNPASQSLSGPNLSREDCYNQLSMQDSKFSSSSSIGGLHPQPKQFSWESDLNRLQPSLGGKLPPEGHFKTSSHLHQLSQKQQSIYNFQYSTSEDNLGLPGKTVSRYPPDVLDSNHSTSLQPFGGSRISAHYNPYASTFEQPLSSKFSSSMFRQENDLIHGKNYDSPRLNHTHINREGVGVVGSRQSASSPKSARAVGQILPRSGGDQYDPLFDSIEPSSSSLKKINYDQKQEATGESNISLRPKNSYMSLDEEEKNEHQEVGAVASTTSQNDDDEYGETADAEVGAVENESLSNHVDVANMTTEEVEINQIKSPGKRKKSKDSRSMKLFKVSIANFVKEVLKPSWRQGNMSKVAFKTIVKKTVDKVSGAMKGHRMPKSQAKISQYIDSSQRKLTKLVMGYVDKYVKV